MDDRGALMFVLNRLNVNLFYISLIIPTLQMFQYNKAVNESRYQVSNFHHLDHILTLIISMKFLIFYVLGL